MIKNCVQLFQTITRVYQYPVPSYRNIISGALTIFIIICVLHPDLPKVLHMLFFFAFRFFFFFFFAFLFTSSYQQQPINRLRLKTNLPLYPNESEIPSITIRIFAGIFHRLFAIRLTFKSAFSCSFILYTI